MEYGFGDEGGQGNESGQSDQGGSSSSSGPKISENLMQISVYYDSFNIKYIENKKIYEVKSDLLSAQPSTVKHRREFLILTLPRLLEASCLSISVSPSRWCLKFWRSF